MKQLTLKEILNELEGKVTVEQLLDGDRYNTLPKTVGRVELIQSVASDYEEKEQGYEEIEYAITYFADHNVYLRTAVEIDSYGRTSYPYGYGKQVFPIEKLITVFE